MSPTTRPFGVRPSSSSLNRATGTRGCTRPVTRRSRTVPRRSRRTVKRATTRGTTRTSPAPPALGRGEQVGAARSGGAGARHQLGVVTAEPGQRDRHDGPVPGDDGIEGRRRLADGGGAGDDRRGDEGRRARRDGGGAGA